MEKEKAVGTQELRDEAYLNYLTGPDKAIMDRLEAILLRSGLKLRDDQRADVLASLEVTEQREKLCHQVVQGDIEAGLLR